MNIISGARMSTGELISQVQDNITFRVTSARDMLMGIRGQSSMSPIQRRREIRDRRLSLVGMGGSSEGTSPSPDTRPNQASTSPTSGQIGTTTTTHGGAGSQTTPSSVPSMTEVDAGTKSRADESGFSQID